MRAREPTQRIGGRDRPRPVPLDDPLPVPLDDQPVRLDARIALDRIQEPGDPLGFDSLG